MPGAAASDPTAAGPAADGAAATSAVAPPPEGVSPATASPHSRIGRIPVVDLAPVVDGGRFPARAVVGEAVPVTATVFREGHDAVAAEAVLLRPDGSEAARTRMVCTNPGLDTWRTDLVPDAVGEWAFRVEAWSDPYGTWEHAASVKVGTPGLPEADVDLALADGAVVLDRAAEVPGRDPADAEHLRAGARGLRDTGRPAPARLAAGTSTGVQEALRRLPLRELVTPSEDARLVVQRPLALFGSWYELFPRSEGAYFDQATGRWVSGTLTTAAERLPALAAQGYDVVYLTPVHPIGRTFRKGRNNTLDATDEDPGSPYAIGSADGGHDAVHPDLGTVADFEAFVARARELDLEVALDLALQCSPDHPWVTEHPEWFVQRSDGSIAYAENPPKKYQDIYPVHFDTDPDGVYAEVLRVVLAWVDRGVTLFRVDNPHTKPVEFWEWLIAEVNRDHPDVIFLAEAFTRPAMMHGLAKVGFQQSYTYFTWRNTKAELEEYVTELTGPSAAYMRPSFWPTTHDILTPFMSQNGRPAFELRAVLAATLAPTWGIYAGYELVEDVPRPGAQEQIDNEKYQYKPRDFDRALVEGRSIAPLLQRLNELRREHPALQRLRGTTFHRTDSEQVIAYTRHLPAHLSPTGEEDLVLVVVCLDPQQWHRTHVHLDMAALGLGWDEQVLAADGLTDGRWTWGEEVYVELGPGRPAHVVSLTRGGGAA
ncbi:alpha-1,4-glucan:maltose-1-phosphate maltosyltransferase [Pseudokineococcus lusitanus]|uniref:Alpha-1,4-glucan:maltose-1-phosphate maltosyltransferase n=1 Tax=Pseudokineococcus lusitanus TaxID=763993 RepID=A0A3N1HMY1_9ACTN|nr:alpha-1,4-glucan:maltose-1-phosphate maltosyltransferase [Pseudokineococcus lusitanus]